MAYKAIDIPRFGGLDLRRDPEESGGGVRALDLRDVEFDMDGRVRMRAGTNLLTSVSGTTYQNLIPFNSNVLGASSQVLTINSSNGLITAFDAASGSSVSTFTPGTPDLPAYIYGAAQIGAPTTNSVLYLTGAGWTSLVKWTGSAFSNVATASGEHRHLAVQSPGNRLVAANSDTTTTYSRVYFSNTNAPETFGGTDYVDLNSGDGEMIVGLANYREFLFAFKQSAFYVFYGNSVDPDGGTVFNYRTVRHGLGTRNNIAGKTVVAGREGVYFIGSDGVYVTDGGFPKKISGQLDAIFENTKDPLGFFTSFETAGNIGIYLANLAYVDGRLYMTTQGDVTSGRSGRVFVYDPRLDAWTFWRMLDARTSDVKNIAAVAAYGSGQNQERPYFLMTSNPSGTTRSVISYLDPSMIQDEDHTGTLVSIVASYRTNFLDFGEPGSMKTIRETLVDGYFSNASMNVYSNNARSAGSAAVASAMTTAPTGTGSALTWPNYALGQTRLRESIRGQNFGFEVQGSAGWAMHRLVPHLRNVRPAGPRLVAP